MQTASKQWVEDMTSEQASFLRELPFTVSFPSHRLLVVHAGFVPNRPIARQDLLEMYTVCFFPPISSLAHQQHSKAMPHSFALNHWPFGHIWWHRNRSEIAPFLCQQMSHMASDSNKYAVLLMGKT